MQEFASSVALLFDTEEMVALDNPWWQVRTIPRTRQLAYMGHTCNFRQTISKFVSSLLTDPRDVPFVMV